MNQEYNWRENNNSNWRCQYHDHHVINYMLLPVTILFSNNYENNLIKKMKAAAFPLQLCVFLLT